jgi:hypothetical protein
MGKERKALGIVCKAGSEGVNSVLYECSKNQRIKEQKSVVTLTMLISCSLLFGLSFFAVDKDLKFILKIIGAALFIGVFITMVFKGSFGYKPTIEEIEEKQFGKKK